MKNLTSKQIARFWDSVSKDGGAFGCWNWTGLKNADGYGKFFASPNYCLAHRVAYEMASGSIPPGLTIDHLCRNRACVNPAHMEPVTLLVNVMRSDPGAYQRAKTECPKGHPYTAENTVDRGNGKRSCLQCQKDSSRKNYLASGPSAGKGVIPKTHCPKGHEYTPENTMLDSKNKTTKRCRTCGRDQVNARRKRQVDPNG